MIGMPPDHGLAMLWERLHASNPPPWFRERAVRGRYRTPGRRDWMADVSTNPSLVVHLEPTLRSYPTQEQLDVLVATSPMVEVVFDGPPA